MDLRILLVSTLVLSSFTGGVTAEIEALIEEEYADARIVHVPTTTLRENEKLIVNARVDGAVARINFMRLYFKSQGEESYDYVEMSEGGGGFFAELSPSQFRAPQLEYFLLTMFTDQSIATHPQWNPYGNPHIVSVAGSPAPFQGSTPLAEPAPGVSPRPVPPGPDTGTTSPPVSQGAAAADESPLLMLSPEPGDIFDEGQDVLIACSFVPGTDSIEINSINLIIDGLNVTLDAEITENLLTYTTSKLKPGTHRLQIQGYYASGAELPPLVLSFQVRGDLRRATASNFSGRFFVETRQESISDIGFSDNNIGANLSGRYGVAKYGGRAFFTSREDSRFQPRHRFSFDLAVGPLGLTLGDAYPRFNDLMLWGKRVRGIHGWLHFGFVNFDIIQGQTNRRADAIYQTNLVTNTSGDTLKSQIDPLADSTITNFSIAGAHEQNLFGMRTSFGSGRNFQLGFNFVKVKDDTTGLLPGEYSTPPQDNVVLGSDLMFAFDNRRIEFRAAGAFSLSTTDITGGPLSKSEIDSTFDTDIPFDPADYKDFLIINASTTPLDPRDMTSVAFNTSFRFNYFNNDFQIGYKSIGSQYNSLGNSFLRNNIQGIFIFDRIRLWKNRLYLNLGKEFYKDNFDNDSGVPGTKLNTDSYGFSIFPGQGYPNLNLNFRNHNRDNDIDQPIADPLNPAVMIDNRENNDSRDITVSATQELGLFNVNHSVSLSFINSSRNDFFNGSRPPGVISSEASSNVQVVSVRTRYNVPLVTTLNFAHNNNEFSGGISDFAFTMFGLKGEYPFLNQRIQSYAGFNITSASGTTASDTTAASITSVTDYTRTTLSAGARFEITNGQYVLFDTNLIFFSDNGVTQNVANPSFTDKVLRIFYEKRL